MENESVKIASLELENVKRIKAVTIEPTPNGLTVIGGRNSQGKTSVLDAIAWALGGERLRPERPTREGSAVPAKLKIVLSNGLTVERSGAKGSLKVSDPSGKTSGQTLLNSFIEVLALNLPKFMAMTDKEKADELLSILGLGAELTELDNKLEVAKAERLELGQRMRASRKMAEDAPYFEDAPKALVSAEELISAQQSVMAKNAENAAKRSRVNEIQSKLTAENDLIRTLEQRLADVQKELTERRAAASELSDEYIEASKTIQDLRDESTEEIAAQLEDIERTNDKVRANMQRAKLVEDAEYLNELYSAKNAECDEIGESRRALLDGADLPLDGLSVEGGKLTYKGATWAEMSSSDQLRVATAIVQKLNPACGFVLVDKLEQMDAQTLSEFGTWASAQGLQIIGTRVATDETCTVIIEDGYSQAPKDANTAAPAPVAPKLPTTKNTAKKAPSMPAQSVQTQAPAPAPTTPERIVPDFSKGF